MSVTKTIPMGLEMLSVLLYTEVAEHPLNSLNLAAAL